MKQFTTPDLEQLFSQVAAGGSYACFEYQGVSLGLCSDEAPLLDWFTTFFGGYFVRTTNTQPDALIHSTHDPRVFERLKELATTHGQPGSDDETEYAVNAQGSIIYSREADPEKGKVEENCFVLSQPGRRVLVAAPGKSSDRQKTVKRSLRNMVKLLFIEKGWLPFHAAACVWNDIGICILGGKYAGKTSTLVNLLTRPRARLVTNDNLFLRDGGGYLEGCGFPNKAGLRIGTLVAYPRLVEWIEKTNESFYPQIDRATFREIVATTPAGELGSRSEKIVLLSTELAAQLDIPIEHVTPIRLVLVVRLDPTLDQSRLVPVTDPRQIRQCLATNLRNLDREKQGFLQRFFDLDDEALKAALDKLVEKLGPAIVVRELSQNANTNEHSALLIGELTQQLQEPA